LSAYRLRAAIEAMKGTSLVGSTTPVALAHDYLTQRGGAERVVLAMLDAFPGAPLYTSLYDPAGTFPEFAGHDIRTLGIDRLGWLRHDHRRALPLLAPAWGRCRIDADLALCSSSGWAHGAQVTGRKVVYCHNPARWLYQADQYLAESGASTRLAMRVLAPWLRRWDRRAAATADRYLCNSSVVRDRVRETYGLEATVVPPPPAVSPGGPVAPVAGVEPGFFLCVSRLQAYKNVDAILDAFAAMPSERLVVVGRGPDGERLAGRCPPNARLAGVVDEPELRWLYASCAGLVAASYEDYGLTPLEAATFGKPSVVLRWGGFLDTVVEGTTGVFFDEPTAASVAVAVEALAARAWDADAIARHAATFAQERFVARLRDAVSA